VVLGTILLQVLQNLVNLLGIPSSLNFAVIGGVILIGVLADQQLLAFRQRSRSGRMIRESQVAAMPQQQGR
jgi:ribose transport system permease protein